ncbi:energy-coupling factor transporter ATPase [Mycoplasmopsis citelli]|uniref:ABC transporter, ATP-binding protein n=1 Tax=Mycoplasmopsis citelli TaxID=171281 RepID=A0A449B297_9BACT|nr:energy-coupling factor transporter ATPase [Mycoplasmopsis citelli]UUD36196.1 energy-coupling factor transporter ATPase [Mycoplasmopsis citelli]VEU74691.1 ABC transporter, ATP-binding protein [Mycoplasmopsis citelli]
MIKVENVTFKYRETDKVPALSNVSFEIQKGEYVAILGHNGSGKSTLSKILSALIKPTRGKVTIDGIIYSRETLIDVRKKIGIVFQNPENQFIGSSVEDDIAFGLENKRMSREEMIKTVRKYAEKVDMLPYLEREPENLSGGQKQRVAIASVLALDPEVIIFDEITSMLDPKGKSKVIEIIQGIREKKDKTLISITHDMDEAILADKCLVFSQGKLIASGKPIDILNNKEIIEIAKIDSPFVYKLSSLIKGIEPTYNEEELINKICK